MLVAKKIIPLTDSGTTGHRTMLILGKDTIYFADSESDIGTCDSFRLDRYRLGVVPSKLRETLGTLFKAAFQKMALEVMQSL